MGTQLPLPNKGAKPPIFGSCLLCPSGCMDQDATSYEGRPQPRPRCVTWGPSSPPKRGIASNLRPMSIVAKRSLWGDGSPSNRVAWAEAYLRTKWDLDPSSCVATINMDQKFGGYAPFLGGGTGFPSSTKSTWLRPTPIPSGILMHPAVWPQ